jgi:hypothetical protein
MGDIWHKYLAVESEIHFDKDQQEIEAFFGAWQDQGFYEDGLFTLQHRDFESDDLFNSAYKSAIQHATSTNSDPHIRWRARIFEYFLKISLPGKCIELGTAHGFMFYFALKRLQLGNFNFADSKIYLIDKYDQQKVDPQTGAFLSDAEIRYANNFKSVCRVFNAFEYVECVQGLIPDILSTLDLNGISFLHIDLNAAQPEVEALRMIWDSLSPNAVVLLDDYGFPNFSSSQLAHSNLAKEFGYDILGLPTGQGLIMKGANNLLTKY